MMISDLSVSVPSYASFYSEIMFDEIESDIGKESKVVSLGMSPAVASYNGFKTADGFFNNYPLEYKLAFREVIQDELSRNEELRRLFDSWGSRCYLFSAELIESCGWSCYEGMSSGLESFQVDLEALKTLGVEFILSAVDLPDVEGVELMRLALNGIFNFSSFPAKLALYLGATRMGLAVLYFGYTLFRYFVFQDVPKGFTTLLFTIIFFSGIQFTILGLMGEYILRIFFQVKSRPNYIVRKRLRFGEEVHEEDSESLSLRQ
jgi:glycosyltransferase involved in cell wall biosynthesis